MNAPAPIALAPIALALALLTACRSSSDRHSPAASSTASRESSTPGARNRSALGGNDVSFLRSVAVQDGDALSAAFVRVERAAAAKDRERAWAAYLDLRKAFRRLLPVAELLTYSSTLEPDDDEPDEIPEDLGLRALGDALLHKPTDFGRVSQVLKRTKPAARLAASEARTFSMRRTLVARALSQGVFNWGRLLDGSRSESADEAQIDALSGGHALTRYSRLLTKTGSSSESLQVKSAARKFDRWLRGRKEEPGDRLGDKLTGLVLSARLGAALRDLFAQQGVIVRAPFAPQRPSSSGKPHAQVVSVATFPRLPGRPLNDKQARVGKKLFQDKRLSAKQSLSCASCHQDRFALSAGPIRPRTFDGKALARDVPGLVNIAYEPMFFWDGRASTLMRQVEIAVENDMGGDWQVISKRLQADDKFVEEMRDAFGDELTVKNIKLALAEHERSLVDDNTPFDRYVRGELGALNAEQLRGFDVFYGRARCSRCHRLPLTSGTSPPRFTKTEISSIGVPTRPNMKQIDPDLGRGGITKGAQHAHAFKVPSLRNLSKTAPYFHNGAFKTLAQVVDFYAAGSGKGLGTAPANFDPDAREFSLTDAERAALLIFLRSAW